MADYVLRVGSRASRLALAQTRQVIVQLEARNRGLSAELVEITTEGDIDHTSPLASMGGEGLFTKQIEQALLDDRIDIAVHSAKDLPSTMIPELRLAAVPERESPNDVWLSKDDVPYDDITAATIVGTGSPRRKAQVLHRHHSADVRGIRGNVETRLKKLRDGDYDGLIMAHAGLKRSGLADAVTEVLPFDRMLPAPGQGALAIQTRAGDERAIASAETLDHAVTHRLLDIERLLMAQLGAGCSTPLGGIARLLEGKVVLSVVLLDESGMQRLEAEHAIATDGDDRSLVASVVDQLLTQGARELIDHA